MSLIEKQVLESSFSSSSEPSSGLLLEGDQTPRAALGYRGALSWSRRIDPQLVRDAAYIADALVLAFAGWVAFETEPVWRTDPLRLASLFAAATILVAYVSLTSATASDIQQFFRNSLAKRLLATVLRTALPFGLTIVLTLTFMPDDDKDSRATFLYWQGVWALAALFAVVINCILLSLLIRRWRARGVLTRRIAIVGHGLLAQRFLERLHLPTAEMIELVGIFDDRAARRSASSGVQHLVCGRIEDLVTLAARGEIDRIFIAIPHAADRRLLMILQKLKHIPIDISLTPDLAGFAAARPSSGEFGGLPIVKVSGRLLEFWERTLKGGVDRLVAAAALLVLLPVFFLIAIAIRLDSAGPTIFRQARYGFGNAVITVYKFRTIFTEWTDDACERQVEHNDERVTRVGWFLRRTSLDELPQLFNVLRGNMALVGPRPMAVGMRVEDKLLHEIVSEYALRHHVKPGVTGLAQVKGYRGPVRTAQSLRTRVAHDLIYIENWSIGLDIWILLRTLGIAFTRGRTT